VAEVCIAIACNDKGAFTDRCGKLILNNEKTLVLSMSVLVYSSSDEKMPNFSAEQA